jgi:hypothetical protein
LGFLPFVTIFEIVTRLPFFATPHGSGKKELGPAGLSDQAICAACNPMGRALQSRPWRLKTCLLLPRGWRCQSGFEEKKEATRTDHPHTVLS